MVGEVCLNVIIKHEKKTEQLERIVQFFLVPGSSLCTSDLCTLTLNSAPLGEPSL